MTPEAIANCARLQNRFDNREAIYVEQGALRVRVTAIQADVAAETITADIEEIPTPGVPGFLGLNGHGFVSSSRLRCTISARHLTAFSDHMWSYGDGGWLLFFHPELLRDVVRFSAARSVALEHSAYQRYRNILGWLLCHKSTQGPLMRVFAPGERTYEDPPPLPEPPALLAEGITFDDNGRTLRWGTPLHELVDIDAANTKWRCSSISMQWPKRTCLGGLPCDVHTGIDFGPPDVSHYHHSLPEFHWAGLNITVQSGADDAACQRIFREVFLRLERIFGPPTSSYPRWKRSDPSLHWSFRGMTIGYFGGSAPRVYIHHTPDGYAALKADARALARWQGTGSGA